MQTAFWDNLIEGQTQAGPGKATAHYLKPLDTQGAKAHNERSFPILGCQRVLAGNQLVDCADIVRSGLLTLRGCGPENH
jgi:hypothetical protein